MGFQTLFGILVKIVIIKIKVYAVISNLKKYHFDQNLLLLM